MKSDLEKEQEELNSLLDEAAETRKELSQQEELKQASADIGRVFKGVGALAFLIFMLILVANKIANIKTVDTSGWIGLGVFFVIVTLAGVKLSSVLEKRTNLSENSRMNISVGSVFIIFGGIIYLFWDSVSQLF